MSGPLTGLKIVELAGLGPTAFAAMMLADHGAEVIRVERPGSRPADRDPLLRSRKIMTADLKSAAGLETVRALVCEADGFIEGFRPGTTERLGLGPDDMLRDNPKLVYGRLTGWGQDGPIAQSAGHDINYIALTGALHAIGTARQPVPPLALLGDFAGGSTMLAFGMVSAMLHAGRTGQGQVVDCAMMDGANVLMTIFHGLMAAGYWEDRREANIVDGAAHWYGVYETLDNRFISIASMEPQFYALLLDRLGLADDPEFVRTEDWQAQRNDKAHWPKLRRRLADIFRTRTRAEWCDLLENTDVCFAPVLSMEEAPHHPHAQAREAFITVNGVVQPAPAPRYSVTKVAPPRPPVAWDEQEARTKIE